MPAAAARPAFAQFHVDLATAFDLPDPASLDEKLRAQGPVVAAGDVPAGHGGQVEPSLLLQFLKRDAPVRAVAAGTVLKVQAQSETCDSEIFVIPDGQDMRTPAWVIGYDHVKNPTVAAGQHINAGDLLGTPGSLFFGCDGPGRVELQINHIATDLAHCPLGFLSASVRGEVQAALRTVMTSWNTRAGQPIYHQPHVEAAGCLAETSKP